MARGRAGTSHVMGALDAVDAEEAMAARGDLFGQVSHLPEGTQVRLRVVD